MKYLNKKHLKFLEGLLIGAEAKIYDTELLLKISQIKNMIYKEINEV